MDKEFQRQIDDIIANFDFNRVSDIMQFMNWHYTFGQGINRVPLVDEIKHNAKILLVYVAIGDYKHAVLEGLKVEKITDNTGSRLTLSFIPVLYEAIPYAR